MTPDTAPNGDQDRVTTTAATVDPDEGRLHRRRTRKPWDDGMMRLPIPLGDGRRAYVLAPQDGLTADECARIANVVAEWHQVDPGDGEPDA